MYLYCALFKQIPIRGDCAIGTNCLQTEHFFGVFRIYIGVFRIIFSKIANRGKTMYNYVTFPFGNSQISIRVGVNFCSREIRNGFGSVVTPIRTKFQVCFWTNFHFPIAGLSWIGLAFSFKDDQFNIA